METPYQEGWRDCYTYCLMKQGKDAAYYAGYKACMDRMIQVGTAATEPWPPKNIRGQNG